MDANFFRRLSDEDIKATAGVSSKLFDEIYSRFCGAKSLIDEKYRILLSDSARYKLYQLLYYLKTYPTARHLKVIRSFVTCRRCCS